MSLSKTSQKDAMRIVEGKMTGFLGMPDLIGIQFSQYWFCIECARLACGYSTHGAVNEKAAMAGISIFTRFEDLQDHFADVHGIMCLKMESGGYRHIFKPLRLDIKAAIKLQGGL